MKYSKGQIYTLIAACLFVVGAIFMLVNTFADAMWALLVGIGFAAVATVFYVLTVTENKKEIAKKLESTKAKEEDKKEK